MILAAIEPIAGCGCRSSHVARLLRMSRVPALLLACATGLIASEELFQGFDPRPTPPSIGWRASAEARWYAESDDRGGEGRLGIDSERLGLSWLAVRTEHDEAWISAQAARTAITGVGQLASGASPVGVYEELALTTSWKHLLGGGSLIGASASLTRDGQLPLSRGMEWGGGATLYGRVGLGEEGRDGLLLALNYDADRLIFGSLPVLPLVAWQGVRGPWLLLLGAPFSVVTYRTDEWQVNAVISPLPSLSADHRLAGPLRICGEVRWAKLQMRRADRAKHDDRLQLTQWEWSGGLRLTAGPAARCDLVGGYATARRLGENSDDGDARRDGIALEAAPFAAFRGRLAF
jgi:hypothetical protein